MARILILRERAAAEATAGIVRAAGHEPVILPLQSIRPLAPEVPAGPFAGFLVTSANAAPFAAARLNGEERPFLAVGRRTAEALRRAGARDVLEGPGDGAGLLEQAAAIADGAGGQALLYLAGRRRTGGLEGALRKAGVPFDTIEVYDTVRLEPEAREAEDVLGESGVDAVLLLSAGQAEGFSDLASRLPRRFEPLPQLLCFSDRIRDALPAAWRARALVSERPELSALLDHYRGKDG